MENFTNNETASNASGNSTQEENQSGFFVYVTLCFLGLLQYLIWISVGHRVSTKCYQADVGFWRVLVVQQTCFATFLLFCFIRDGVRDDKFHSHCSPYYCISESALVNVLFNAIVHAFYLTGWLFYTLYGSWNGAMLFYMSREGWYYMRKQCCPKIEVKGGSDF